MVAYKFFIVKASAIVFTNVCTAQFSGDASKLFLTTMYIIVNVAVTVVIILPINSDCNMSMNLRELTHDL